VDGNIGGIQSTQPDFGTTNVGVFSDRNSAGRELSSTCNEAALSLAGMSSQEIGFGIVGTGMIAGVHAQAIAAVDGARLVGVVSRSAERGGEFIAKHGGDTVAATVEELVAQPGINVLCVTTPSGAHLEPALAAIAAGKHLVVEKPIEITTARVDELLDAAAKAGVRVAPIFQQRFSEGAQALKAAIEAGRFGRLTSAGCYVKWFREESYYTGSNWKGTVQFDGGGAVMNQGIHGVDLLQWLVGLPEEVMGYTTRRVHRSIEVEDTAVASLRFPDGALGTIEATTAAWPGWAMRIEICGENGSARLEDGVITEWNFRDENANDAVSTGGDSALGSGAANPAGISIEGHRRQIADMVAAVSEDRPLAIDGPAARNAVALINALYASAARGRPERVG
jgi:UDP-N-acetyl-2-amino-2-deoxyglucuronate dehydrogenase